MRDCCSFWLRETKQELWYLVGIPISEGLQSLQNERGLRIEIGHLFTDERFYSRLRRRETRNAGKAAIVGSSGTWPTLFRKHANRSIFWEAERSDTGGRYGIDDCRLGHIEAR
jgi:hypothetical protein